MIRPAAACLALMFSTVGPALAEMDRQLFPTAKLGAHACGILSSAAARCAVAWPEAARRAGLLTRAKAWGATGPQIEALGSAWDRGAEFGDLGTPCTPRERIAAEEARASCAAVLGK